jgi:hypothetical protein
MDHIEQALRDPENQPSQFGTVPVDDPRFTVIEWHPIEKLDRSRDNTYLVRVRNIDLVSPHRGWVDKGYYANDEHTWYDDAGKKIERSTWRIAEFAEWPALLPR